MILTCDECRTRYLLPSHLLGPDGRRVRCTICQYEWFQAPDDDSGAGYATHEIEEIPNSVKPIAEDGELPVILAYVPPAPSMLNVKITRGAIMGFAAAVAVFIVIAAGFLAARDPVMRFWPSSIALYDLAGLTGTLPGEGLIFEDLRAVTSFNAEGIEILRVDGQIMNIKAYPVKVPALRMALRREDGSETEHWVLDEPGTVLEARQSMPFTSSYPQIAEDVKELNARFILE